ncbi:neuronal PAS domain protein dysfusion isoform X2 [Rhodnius prolixus]
MALVCVYVRKANYFQQVFKRHESHHGLHHIPTPNIGFSKALSGFLMMMTQNGKLLYISDNAAEYLGHSMEDLLIHGDSMYDMIDKQDHQGIQTELLRSANSPGDDNRIFLCRMNVSRNARRQMRFGDQKVVLVQGHYLSFLPLCSRNEPVFLATCTPVAMPETRECVVQGATNVFTTIHSMDMKFVHVDRNGEWHLGFPRSELQGASWYQLLHWDSMREAQNKHRLITQSEQDRSCILLIRIQRRNGDWLWIHCVLQVKDNMENSQQPLIVATNQVLSETEAGVMRVNSWLYHYYTVQSKLQYGLAYEPHAATQVSRMASSGFYQHAQAMSPYHHQESPAPNYHHQVSPPSHHHQGIPQTLTTHPEAFRYGRHTEPEPVDYSVHHEQDIKASPRSSPASEDIVDLDRGGSGGGGTTVLMSSASPATQSLGRSRLLVKAATSLDPADVMEQWNPSPPWSDTTLQKVPDILHQDLSPYVTTTPPTPGSAVSLQHPPTPAFTFDWTPEQYVPNMQPCTPVPLVDEEHTLLGCFSWSAAATPVTEHRLFPLQPPPTHRPSLIVRIDQEPDHLLMPTIKDERQSSSL